MYFAGSEKERNNNPAMKRLRDVAVLPTLFTLGNLVCGFFAIVVAARVEPPISVAIPTAEAIETKNPARAVRGLKPYDPTHNCMLSGLLIFLAMVFDAFDGYMARWSKKATQFGSELDSLCDVVSFGVAPGFLLVKMCPTFTYQHRDLVWTIAAAFAVCAALRLARFNVESDEQDDHMNFSGLPSPAAAGAVASFAILFYTLRKETSNLLYAEQIDYVVQSIVPFFALLCALLMVSRVPYPHVINQALRGTRSFNYIVALVFATAAVLTIRGFSLPIVCCIFVLSGPVTLAWRLANGRSLSDEPIF